MLLITQVVSKYPGMPLKTKDAKLMRIRKGA